MLCFLLVPCPLVATGGAHNEKERVREAKVPLALLGVLDRSDKPDLSSCAATSSSAMLSDLSLVTRLSFEISVKRVGTSRSYGTFSLWTPGSHRLLFNKLVSGVSYTRAVYPLPALEI